MQFKLNICAASVVALAAVTGSAAPALAGDWNNGDGSLKDPRGRAAVAVPAPMPIPETVGIGWYIRGDVGIGRAGSKEISESGSSYGHNGVNSAGNIDQMIAPGATSPFGSSPSWFNNDGKTLFNYGVGVGYHWSKNFRTDVTLDRRYTDMYSGKGNYAYTYTTTGPTVGGVPGALISTTSVRGTLSDDTQVKSGTMLLNGYYDVGSRHGFTPYIGAGVGLAMLNTSRQVVNSESATICPAVCGVAPATVTSTNSASSNAKTLSFAGMATVGVAYSLTQNTAIDVNYRYLFINGQDITAGNSKVTLGDIGEHQLRAGLRWDIN
jgi:opacity protein-like surface antigen